eukprot:TRINITY_DN1976_c0_g1_i10.p1 TRINITY_DN1976_c0_g1~~TRINITY_DN1976_c0_g1_i10.p1  ORF type:complete len:548 (+),score=119.40 TRINITY_DN1976_c0_g1_i10:372-2015(+)
MMDENPELFQQNEIHIALCFKTGFTLCDGGMEFFNWTSLIDDFYDRANQIISKHSLKVEFILDGSAPVTDETECLKDKWRPWVYTYVSFRNPALAYFENWTRDGYDRFAILNEPVDSIDPTFLIKMVAISDYGKFSKQQKYPYLNWEPNNQKPIKEVIDVYLDKGLVQEAGFKFAINMDPVQLEVYAGSLSKKAWNERLPITTDFRPLMTVLPFSGENVIVKLQRTKKDCVSYEIMSNTVQFGPIKSMVTGKTDCYLQSINSISSIVSGQDLFQILVSDWEANWSIFSMDNDYQLTLTQNGKMRNSTWLYSSSITSFQNETLFLFLKNVDDCGMFLEISNPLTGESSGDCLLQTSADSAAMDVIQNGDKLSVIIFYSHKNNIFSILGNYSQSSLSFIHSNGAIGVGKDPSVSLAEYNNEIYLLEMHGDSWCWNSEQHNKNPILKQCDFKPKSIPAVLTYSFGKLGDFSDFLLESKQLSSCHDDILHGMYDMGFNTSAKLFVSQVYGGVLSMMEIHEGIDASQKDKEACGLPIPHQGFLIDGWNLPSI